MPSPPRMHMASPPRMHVQNAPNTHMPSAPKMHANNSTAHSAKSTPKPSSGHASASAGASASKGAAGGNGSAKAGSNFAFHPSATASAIAPLNKPGALTNTNFNSRYWGYHNHYHGYRNRFYRRTSSFGRGLYRNQYAMRWLMRLRRDLNTARSGSGANMNVAQNIQRDLHGVVNSRTSTPSQAQTGQLATDVTTALATGRGGVGGGIRGGGGVGGGVRSRVRGGFNSMGLARNFMTVVNRGSHNGSSLQRAISSSHGILVSSGVPAGMAGRVSSDLTAIASGGGMNGGQIGMLR
jgi:hypothetical protein